MAKNPTSNLFALLAEENEPSFDVRAPVKKEKKAAAKPADAPAATIPTPAEKAKAREAAKAAEAAKASAAAAARPAKTERAPRQEGAPARGRSIRGGRGARRELNAQPHRHEAPAHGRPQDRQSQGKYSRNPPPKKGGAGKGNWGDEVKDSVVNKETAALVDGWSAEKPAVDETKKDEKKEEAVVETEAETQVEPEPEDNTKTLDDYLKAREAAAAALLAKVGAVQTRQVENTDMTGAYEKERPAEEKKEKKEVPTARKGEKAISVADVFQVRLPPIGGERSERGRPRGRGGRGARGEVRKDGAPRAGPRGGHARPIDVSSSRQFPTLGQ